MEKPKEKTAPVKRNERVARISHVIHDIRITFERQMRGIEVQRKKNDAIQTYIRSRYLYKKRVLDAAWSQEQNFQNRLWSTKMKVEKPQEEPDPEPALVKQEDMMTTHQSGAQRFQDDTGAGEVAFRFMDTIKKSSRDDSAVEAAERARLISLQTGSGSSGERSLGPPVTNHKHWTWPIAQTLTTDPPAIHHSKDWIRAPGDDGFTSFTRMGHQRTIAEAEAAVNELHKSVHRTFVRPSVFAYQSTPTPFSAQDANLVGDFGDLAPAHSPSVASDSSKVSVSRNGWIDDLGTPRDPMRIVVPKSLALMLPRKTSGRSPAGQRQGARSSVRSNALPASATVVQSCGAVCGTDSSHGGHGTSTPHMVHSAWTPSTPRTSSRPQTAR